MKFFTKKADLPPGKAERVPPGQYLTEKWPVLHYGPVPTFNPKTWDLRVFGKVKNELRWTWDEFQALDKELNTQVTADMHCVTTWSRLDQKWEGVSFAKIVELAQPTDEAKFVIAHSEYGFTANIPIEYCLRDDCLVALARERRGPHRGARPARAARRPAALRVEEREVAARHRVLRERQARLLGAQRLPQHRRSMERGALLG